MAFIVKEHSWRQRVGGGKYSRISIDLEVGLNYAKSLVILALVIDCLMY